MAEPGLPLDRLTRLDVRVNVGEDWLTLDHPRALPAARVAEWAEAKDLSCCSLQGGFFIEVNGKPWSTEGAVDEFTMTLSWLEAIAALARGAASYGPGYGPWEESALTWTRQDDLLSMIDVHPSGNVSMPKVTLSFSGFVRAFLPAAAEFAHFLSEVRRLAVALPESSSQREVILANTPADEASRLVESLGRALEPVTR